MQRSPRKTFILTTTCNILLGVFDGAPEHKITKIFHSHRLLNAEQFLVVTVFVDFNRNREAKSEKYNMQTQRWLKKE